MNEPLLKPDSMKRSVRRADQNALDVLVAKCAESNLTSRPARTGALGRIIEGRNSSRMGVTGFTYGITVKRYASAAGFHIGEADRVPISGSGKHSETHVKSRSTCTYCAISRPFTNESRRTITGLICIAAALDVVPGVVICHVIYVG
jgi:hypothetical protein